MNNQTQDNSNNQNETVYIISDIEMGRGDITDDFSDDEKLIEFIKSIHSNAPEEEISLVLNGDIFDFLKMEYKRAYPRHITESISLWKLDEVIKAHPRVFKALKEFIQNRKHQIYFVIGNHDPDIAWPAVQSKLQSELNNQERINFSNWYQNKNLHAEHGNLEDTFFTTNPNKPFNVYKGEKILNLPWGSQACFSHLITLKKKFPKEEQYFPRHVAMKQNKAFKKASRNTSLNLAAKSLFIAPIKRIKDPTYKIPYTNFAKHILKFGLEILDDEKLMQGWIKSITRKHKNITTFVFGHAHVLFEKEQDNKKIIVTDTWRDEYLIENGKKKKKTYAKIEYKNGELTSAKLHTFK